MQQVALGGRKRLPRVGECIVADGRRPCQRQPLRGQPVPSRGANPSTWFVDLRGDEKTGFNAFGSLRCGHLKKFFAKQPRRLASFAWAFMFRRPCRSNRAFVVGAEDKAGRHNGSRRVYLRIQPNLFRVRAVLVPAEQTNRAASDPNYRCRNDNPAPSQWVQKRASCSRRSLAVIQPKTASINGSKQ